MARITLQSRPGSIEFEFQLSWAEQQAAAKILNRTFRTRLGMDRHWRLLVWSCGGLMLAGLAVVALSGASAGGWFATALAGSAAPVLLGGYRFMTRLEARRVDALPGDGPVRQNWRLGPEGVDVAFGSSRLHLAWSDVRNVRCADGLILLFVDETDHLTVPDRAFFSLGHRRRFLAYVKVAIEVSRRARRHVARAA